MAHKTGEGEGEMRTKVEGEDRKYKITEERKSIRITRVRAATPHYILSRIQKCL